MIPITQSGALAPTQTRWQVGNDFGSTAAQAFNIDQELLQGANLDLGRRFQAEEAGAAQRRWEVAQALAAAQFEEQQRQFSTNQAQQNRQFNAGVDQQNAARADQNYWRGVESSTAAMERDAARAMRAQEMSLQLGAQAEERAGRRWEWDQGRNDRLTDRADSFRLDREKLGLERQRLGMYDPGAAIRLKNEQDLEKSLEAEAAAGLLSDLESTKRRYPSLPEEKIAPYVALSIEERKNRASDYFQQKAMADAVNDAELGKRFQTELAPKRSFWKPYSRELENYRASLPRGSEMIDFMNKYGIGAKGWSDEAYAPLQERLTRNAPNVALMKEPPVYWDGFRQKPVLREEPYFKEYQGVANDPMRRARAEWDAARPGTVVRNPVTGALVLKK